MRKGGEGLRMSRIQIASHRGRFGGNVVENTIPAFEAALYCGADILQTDRPRELADYLMK